MSGTASRSRPTGTELCVPADDDALACPECGRLLATERRRVLHRGLAHYGALDDAERAAFRDAYREETDDLRSTQLVAVGLLVLLYFGLLIVYFLVT